MEENLRHMIRAQKDGITSLPAGGRIPGKGRKRRRKSFSQRAGRTAMASKARIRITKPARARRTT